MTFHHFSSFFRFLFGGIVEVDYARRIVQLFKVNVPRTPQVNVRGWTPVELALDIVRILVQLSVTEHQILFFIFLENSLIHF